MKNHIGYLESTALKRLSCGYTGQKKRFPTKNPRFNTVFVVFSSYHTASPLNAIGIEAVNLPDLFGPRASL
jgi:hypothetical protein